MTDSMELVGRLTQRAADYRTGGPSSEHTAIMLDEAAACIREMVEWRKASDTKPQDEQQVWVNLSYPGGMVSQGYAIWSDDDGWWFDVETDGTLLSRKAAIEQGLEAAEVTHWLPLPPAPGAEDE